MNDSPSRQYGADMLRDVLAENSELAHFDTLAIIAALNRQTDLLRQLTSDIQTLRQQLNTPTAPSVSQLDGARPIDAAVTWLRENDPLLKLTAREAAIKASMSQATINRAQQKLRKGG